MAINKVKYLKVKKAEEKAIRKKIQDSLAGNYKMSFVEFVDAFNALAGYNPQQVEAFLAGKLRAARRTPDLHRRMADFMEKNKDRNTVLMAYRFSGKSFLLNLFCCWLWYIDPNTCILMVSAYEKLAYRNSNNIRDTLEGFILTKHLVPQGKYGFEKDTTSKQMWQRNCFNVNRPVLDAHYSLLSISIESKITGLHADIIFCDDLEVAENSNTPEKIENMRERMNELFAMVGKGNLFLVGTPHAGPESLYKYLIEKLGFSHAIFPAYVNGKPIDPELHDEEFFIKLRSSITDAAWQSQYMCSFVRNYETILNMEIVENDLLYDSECLSIRTSYSGKTRRTFMFSNPYTGETEKIMDMHAYYDVASGKQHRDLSVFTIVGHTDRNNFVILLSESLPEINEHQGPDVQIYEVIGILKQWPVSVVMVESTGVGLGFPAMLREAARKARLQNVSIKQSIRKTDKKDYILDTLEPLIKTRQIYFPKELYTTVKEFRVQLTAIGLEKKSKTRDDYPDSIAGAIRSFGNIRYNINKIEMPEACDMFGGPIYEEVSEFPKIYQGHSPVISVF